MCKISFALYVDIEPIEFGAPGTGTLIFRQSNYHRRSGDGLFRCGVVHKVSSRTHPYHRSEQSLQRRLTGFRRLRGLIYGIYHAEDSTRCTCHVRAADGGGTTEPLPRFDGAEEIAIDRAGDLVVIEKNIPQSVVAFGHRGPKRSDPDFYAAYVVNYILGGGGFSSRLYEEIREKRGLAYSVYAYLGPLNHAGLLGGGVATQNSRVGESIALIRQEWARMAADGPSEAELEAAKTFLTGSYPLRQSSSGRIANMLLGIQMENLGIDYINRRNDLIEAVTIEDAKRVAKRVYDEALLTFVVVGQPAGVSPTRDAPGGS